MKEITIKVNEVDGTVLVDVSKPLTASEKIRVLKTLDISLKEKRRMELKNQRVDEFNKREKEGK
jgi:hypothetical protein